MALINCPECGKLISEQAPTCPHCGAPVGNASRVSPAGSAPAPRKGNQLLVILAVVAVVLLGAGVGFYIGNKDKQPEQPATEAVEVKDTTAAEKKDTVTPAVVEEPKTKPAPAKSQLSEKKEEAAAPVYTGKEVWKGAIGGKYKVHMVINNNTGEFYYYYDKYGSKNVFWLTCVYSSDNNITLVEENRYGEQTGMFEGRLRGNTYSGTFYNLHKGTSYSFHLTRQ